MQRQGGGNCGLMPPTKGGGCGCSSGGLPKVIGGGKRRKTYRKTLKNRKKAKATRRR